MKCPFDYRVQKAPERLKRANEARSGSDRSFLEYRPGDTVSSCRSWNQLQPIDNA